MLQVRVIGTFDIQCDGTPITLSSRAAQSLFAYLILTAGTAHRREKLGGMFWPDTSERKARAYLRNEMWRIRKALAIQSNEEYLHLDDICVCFIPSAEYWMDFKELANLNESASIDQLMAALSHCQGELLPGFYDEWILLEREHCRAIYEQKIARLLDLLERERRWQETVEWAERWIALGQGPEAAYRFLIGAYDALGDRTKVASTYQQCLQALRELDLEPSEQTRALAFKQASKIKIPIPLTRFIGRDKELKEVAELLSKSRLVTLTGSGGVGKTRLAIQVVAEVMELFPDGVWFLDLAPLSDPTLVPQAIVTTLGLIEQGGRSPAMILTDFLQIRRALLILDNCEHLIHACAQLAETLLHSCPSLQILATSREPLRSGGELPYRVPSLEVPKRDIEFNLDELSNMESVKLFTERAQIAWPGFALNSQNIPAIAQICQRLDGIPLAIELAAARTNVLTVEQILKRLDDRFTLLTGGLRTSLPRHQTLQATIEWSFSLLSEQERFLFRRLAVFAGGWTLEAAEEVCSGNGIESRDILDLLSQLVNKSLVTVENLNGEIRYRMLETIGQFALEKLGAASEANIIRQRHLAYFVGLAERAEPNLRAFNMVMWLDRLEAELDNIRVALEGAQERNIEAQLRLAGALLWFWHIRGHKNEGIEWLEQGLSAEAAERRDQPISLNRSLIRGKALNVAGFLSLMLAETDKGAALAENSLILFRELGAPGKRGMAYALFNLSEAADRALDFRRKKILLEKSLALFQQLGDKLGIVQCTNGLGFCALDEEDYHQGRRLFEECLALCEEIGDIDGRAFALLGLGSLASQQGDFKHATVHYETSLSLFRELGNSSAIGMALSFLGQTAQAHGDYGQAARMLEQALALLNQNLGDKFAVASRLNELGSVARSQGDYERAMQLHEQALTLFRKIDNEFAVAYTLRHLGFTALARADYAQALRKFEESLAIGKEASDPLEVAFALYGMGRVAQAQGDFTLARQRNIASIMIFQEITNPADVMQGMAHCLEAFAILAVAQRKMRRAVCLFSASERLYAPLIFEMSAAGRAEHDQAMAVARVALGEETFVVVWAEGQTMTLDAAVTFAVEELQSS